MDVIAEIGLTHEGSLGNALCMIDAAAAAGASGVKFQCHDGDPVDKFRMGTVMPQDFCRQDYWERTAFKLYEWKYLRAHAKSRGLLFIVSAFSHAGVHTAKAIEADAIKLGSGAMLNESLRAACFDRWLILSTGLSSMAEALEVAKNTTAKRLTVLQCTSVYPCPARMVGMQAATQIRNELGSDIEVGLSDHSGTIWPSIVAAARQLSMVEVHVCYSREQFGPDVPASVTFKQLKKLVEGVRFVEEMHKPFSKDEMASITETTRNIFAPCESVAY